MVYIYMALYIYTVYYDTMNHNATVCYIDTIYRHFFNQITPFHSVPLLDDP